MRIIPKRVISEPGIMGGTLTFEGTRVSVLDLLVRIDKGESREELRQDFNHLTSDDFRFLDKLLVELHASRHFGPSLPEKLPTHRYRVLQRCIFTNRGVSGVTSNDGKHCTISRLKPPEEWAQGEPEYVIRFADGNAFGARERELEPAKGK